MSEEHKSEAPAAPALPLPAYRVTRREGDTVYLSVPGVDDDGFERGEDEHGLDLATARRLRDELGATLGDAPGDTTCLVCGFRYELATLAKCEELQRRIAELEAAARAALAAEMQPPETAPVSTADEMCLFLVAFEGWEHPAIGWCMALETGGIALRSWHTYGVATAVKRRVFGWWPLPAMPARGGEAKEIEGNDENS